MPSPYLASLFLFATSSPPVDTLRQSLSAHSDRMFFGLVVSSVITGVGVIFEAPAEIHELGRWWKLRRLGKPIGWRVPITFFGLILVIGGIVGEGIFEFLSADAETAIRGYDEQVLGDTIVQAGEAKDSAKSAATDATTAKGASAGAVTASGTALTLATSARKEADTFEADIKSANTHATEAESHLAEANARAAEADAKAEGFRSDIAKANAASAQASAQVAEAQREAASANETAERERLARLQLEARLADRVISPDQRLRITAVFAPMKGQTVDVVFSGDTPEVSRTADAIIGCISAAGVLVNLFHPMQGGGAQGVVIGIKLGAPAEDKMAGEQLVRILRESLGGGVGTADFDKIAITGTGTVGGTPGATPAGQSPFRLQIAPK